MFHFLWYEVLYAPLYNLLLFFYSIQPEAWRDMGLAVIFLTIFIRVLLLPFSIRAARSEHRLDKLRPYIEKVKTRYKYDLEKQRAAIRKLLRDNRIGVYSSAISVVFQLMVFLVLYEIFSSGLQPIGHNHIYPFNLDPGVIEPMFLNRLNLIVPNLRASLITAGLVLVSQIVKKFKNMGETTAIEKALIIGLPIGTFMATIILPSAKAIFLSTSVIFTLWIRLIRWLVVKYIVKDDKLKKNIEQLWTS